MIRRRIPRAIRSWVFSCAGLKLRLECLRVFPKYGPPRFQNGPVFLEGADDEFEETYHRFIYVSKTYLLLIQPRNSCNLSRYRRLCCIGGCLQSSCSTASDTASCCTSNPCRMLHAVSTSVPRVAAASAYEQSERQWEPHVRMVGRHNVREGLGVAGTAL